MQIVIEIPKDEYEIFSSCTEREKVNELSYYELIIANGTPLPEHHGRLIDADTLEECKEMMSTIMGEWKYAVRMDDIRNVPTIIPATKEGE